MDTFINHNCQIKLAVPAITFICVLSLSLNLQAKNTDSTPPYSYMKLEDRINGHVDEDHVTQIAQNNSSSETEKYLESRPRRPRRPRQTRPPIVTDVQEDSSDWLEQEQVVRELLFKGDELIIRMQLEAKVGSVASTEMSADARRITISFKPDMQFDLEKFVENLEMEHALLSNVSTLSQDDGVQTLIVEFTQSLKVVDETLAATTHDMSRWEIVLTSAVVDPLPIIDEALPAPRLDEISLTTVGGLFSIELKGSAGLLTEVSFNADPPEFNVELPGIDVDVLNTHAEHLNEVNDNPEILSVSSEILESGYAGLVFHLKHGMDMIDASGQITDEQGIILLSLVPDAIIDNDLDKKLGLPNESDSIQIVDRKLKGITISEVGKKLSLSLEGTEGTEVNAYVLNNPPRLMLDFMGWKPEQIYDAVASFKPVHPVIKGIRYGETRLGSARIELGLAANSQVLDTMVRKGFDSTQESFIVSLEAPQHLSWDTGEIIADSDTPLDLRYHPEYDFSRTPEIIVRSVELENASAFEEAESPVKAQQYELIGFYEKALRNDNNYRAAKSDYLANVEVLPQARAGYFPVASFDYGYSRIHQDIIEATNAAFPTGSTGYGSRNWTMTITQPIIDVQAWVAIDQAKLSSEQAKLNLLSAEQDLILRVAEGYLTMLAAKDAFDLAETEFEVTEKQYDLAKTRLQGGLGTAAN